MGSELRRVLIDSSRLIMFMDIPVNQALSFSAPVRVDSRSGLAPCPRAFKRTPYYFHAVSIASLYIRRVHPPSAAHSRRFFDLVLPFLVIATLSSLPISSPPPRQ